MSDENRTGVFGYIALVHEPPGEGEILGKRYIVGIQSNDIESCVLRILNIEDVSIAQKAKVLAKLMQDMIDGNRESIGVKKV